MRGRPMSTKTSDNDRCLWFLTHKDSAKVLEVQDDSRVNVSFADPSKYTFVSVSGHASVTDDKAKIDELWTADAGLWFDDGKNDPNLTLIKVEPTDAEYWSSKNGSFVTLFKMAKAAVTGEQPDIGVNEKLDM